jgi:ADP-heptose:LPS heptosyltransferase
MLSSNAPVAVDSGVTGGLPRKGIFRILVCRTSHSLGNTLFMTPLLQEIESQWPGAEVDLVTRYASAPQIIRTYSSVRKVMLLPKQWTRHPFRCAETLLEMRRTHYDLAIDTDRRSRTGRLFLKLARARHKLGFAGRGALTVEVSAEQAPKHAAHFPVYLLRRALSQDSGNYPGLSMKLTRPEATQGRAQLLRVVGPKNRRGVIGIFANATGPKAMSRQWWREFMAVVEAHLTDYAFVEIIPAFGQSMLESRYPTYFSSDIRNLAKFMSALSMLISLDCGIMHLARASGTPVGAVFTTTDVEQWGPYGPGAYFVAGDDQHPREAAQRLMDVVPLASTAAA